MNYELAHMGLVYSHLIACCVAIGVVLINDIDMVRQLLGDKPAKRLDPHHLTGIEKIVGRALLALWVTGAALISMDAYTGASGWETLLNPKLQAKIAIVALLTLNGVALHRYVLPWLKNAGSLLRLSFRHRMLAVFSGAASGVSWFYAAMLGIGRPLDWKYSLFEILLAYPFLIATGFATMVLLTAWSRHKTLGESQTFEDTAMAGAG